MENKMFSLREKILSLIDPFVRVPVAGLDISDRSLKYLQLTSHAKPDFDLFGELPLPVGLIVNGEIIKEDELVKILRSWLSREGRGLKSSAVVASLPEEKSFLRLIQIPKIKMEEIKNAIRWEIETNIPLPPDQLTYDYEVIEPLEDHLDHYDVLIVAFPKQVIESYARTLRRAGLEPMALELESQAIVRATVDDPRSRPAKIIVDMGRSRTSFIIFAGGAINFTSTIELGGGILEENIVRELKVSPEEAGRIKRETGLNRKEHEGKVFSALAPAIAVLADELRKTINYYRTHSLHRHGATVEIESLLLTGGDANLLGLETYLAASLKIPTYPANPLTSWSQMNNNQVPPLPKKQLLAFTTVIGLSMRAVQ